MTFQFLCPQGHLLQGDEAHMGMQCQCPQCGTAFIIPTIEAPAAGSSQDMTVRSPTPHIELEPLGGQDAFNRPASAPSHAASMVDPAELSESELGSAIVDENLVHIPCPNGHELETPMDMIGQRAKCPHCGVEFRLKREKSIEYLRQQEIIERRRAAFWFQLAILTASFVGVVLLAMIVISSLSR